jgi:hypothetical protein
MKIRIWLGHVAGLVAWFEFADWVEKGVHLASVEAVGWHRDVAFVLAVELAVAWWAAEQVGESVLWGLAKKTSALGKSVLEVEELVL